MVCAEKQPEHRIKLHRISEGIPWTSASSNFNVHMNLLKCNFHFNTSGVTPGILHF